MDSRNNQTGLMEKIISLCKRRGFVFPSSEIYGGFSSIYDFGPYGAELANAVKKEWWHYMVQKREDIVGLDSAIFMNPKTWEASGHTDGFSDPLIECRECHSRLRADHLLEEIGVFADEKMSEDEINEILDNNKDEISCPKCGEKNFTKIKKFNLLVKSNLGNFTNDWSKDPVYLRGETCQGIYVNYKNVLNSSRAKIPFGIGQIGKAFRNEITARQFIFRTREFEQMEMQYFVHPQKEMEEYEKLKEYRWNFYRNLGIKENHLRWKEHENLVFYAKAAYDIEYDFPFGWKELEGIHARGNYDLSRHTQYSGKDLSYTDPTTKENYIPHIIESSAGVGRTILMLLVEAYTEEPIEGKEERVVMKFPRKLAPIKVAVIPLLKNKPDLIEKARKIYDDVKEEYMAEFDNSGNVGKSYRRQDEIGTPVCVTIDFESLEKDDVTVRDRDTMEQKRIKTNHLKDYLEESLK